MTKEIKDLLLFHIIVLISLTIFSLGVHIAFPIYSKYFYLASFTLPTASLIYFLISFLIKEDSK